MAPSISSKVIAESARTLLAYHLAVSSNGEPLTRGGRWISQLQLFGGWL
jgi:hypothetical protein